MPRGKKTSPELIYEIMSSWSVTNNYKETARLLDIPVSTVKNIVDRNRASPEFEKLQSQKKSEFSENASRIIDKAMARLEKDIDDAEKNIPVNHLTTVIGTLMDKKALADGTATENVKVEIKLPPGVDEYAG